MSYVLIAKSLNFAPFEKMIEGTDLSETSLATGDSLPVSDAIQLVHNLMKHSHTTNWPAIFGAHLGVAAHGPVGNAAVAAPSLGASLSTFAEWFRIRCETYRCRTTEFKDEFVIEIQDTTGDQIFEGFFFESFIRAFEVIIGLVMGEQISGQTTLEFKTAGENRRQLLQEEYDSRLVFGKTKNLMRIPRALWEQPSPLSDPQAFKMNLQACQQIEAERKDRLELPSMVKQIMMSHFERVISPDRPAGPPPSLRDICAQLHIVERTLIRKLKAQNTAYKKLLDEARFHFAKSLLDKQYRVSEVADRLGYRESASFCRAFRRWSGCSPSSFQAASKT